MLQTPAADAIKEQGLKLPGDRAALAAAYGAVVQFADRRDLGCGAGEEGFIGAIYLVPGDALFDHRYAQFVREGNDGVTSDAFQTGGQVGRVQPTLFHD